ncbi:MAG: beta-galactosidase [Phycisphaerae bacterium]
MNNAADMPRRDVLKLMLLGSAAGVPLRGRASSAATTEIPTKRPFFQPHRIRYDGQSLFVEDKPFFLYGGSFHYYRCPKPLWRARFEKIKQAGFNTVQTYVPWNISETQQPSSLSDFSQVRLNDLDDWLRMAIDDFGFYVTIRPGPYICAEWDTGGFPQWLLTYKPRGFSGEWLRSDNPTFMAWSRHWYDAVCPVIAPHQLTRQPIGKPGVLLFQVENEYDFPAMPLHVKRRYVASLVDGALHNGIEVPLFINWGNCVLHAQRSQLHRVFDTMDFYPRAHVSNIQPKIAAMRRNQPDAPLMTAELQGGWFSTVYDTPYLRTDEDHYGPGIGPEQINNLTLFCLQKGVTIVNFYMLFGGTNFGGHPARSIATSYDYSAPIRENGGVGDKYLRVQALGTMLKRHGPDLARSHEVQTSATSEHADVGIAAREVPDGGIYVFVRKISEGQPRSGQATVTAGRLQAVRFHYSLKKFGAKILYFPPAASSAAEAKWLPENLPAMKRPSRFLPDPVEIAYCRTAVDPTPTQWRPVKPGQSLADLGYYQSGFNYYRAGLKLPPQPKQKLLAALVASVALHDTATAMLDDKLLYDSGSGEAACVFKPEAACAPGLHNALLVYENRGHANGGMAMEKLYGIFDLSLNTTDDDQRLLQHWQLKRIAPPKNTRHVEDTIQNVSTAGWHKTVCRSDHSATQLAPNSWAVFRCQVVLTPKDIQSHRTQLVLTRVADKGWVFVNNQLFGSTNHWSQVWAFDAAKALQPGSNSIAVLVQNGGHRGGLGLVKLTSRQSAEAMSHLVGPLEIAAAPVGLERRWHQADFDDRHWRSYALPQGPNGSVQPHLLSWHRMDFDLPKVPEDIWVPWCLKIQAVGTGFIYLNGHEYGRFWQDGGQREYYLPECWLQPRGQGKNVIALCLRAVNRPARILSASIVPYRLYAEYRRL